MEEITVEVEDALALIERQESHFWDHKSVRSTGAVVQKAACAFANTDGGEFIVGVEDSRVGTGLDRWKGFTSIEAATPVLDALARDVKPPVPYQVEFLTIRSYEDLGIAVNVTIGKSESVHHCSDDRVYVRRGASSSAVTGQTITDLNLSKGARSYEDQVLGDYDIRDLVEERELHAFWSPTVLLPNLKASVGSNG